MRAGKTVREEDEIPALSLAALAEQAITERGRRCTERHLYRREATPRQDLNSFDFDAVPTISKAQVMALVAGGSWVERGADK